jgi:hypothetical protein
MKLVSVLSHVTILSVGSLLAASAHADQAASAECSIPSLFLHSSLTLLALFTTEERRTPWSFPR